MYKFKFIKLYYFKNLKMLQKIDEEKKNFED